jgi:polyhydroxyalkanoate synthesis repressor PhaR
MMEPVNPVVIKKYGNRRLYNTTTSTYENVESLAGMARRGENFIVYDAKSGDDITRSVLRHIVSEEEKKSGQDLLPVASMRRLIGFLWRRDAGNGSGLSRAVDGDFDARAGKTTEVRQHVAESSNPPRGCQTPEWILLHPSVGSIERCSAPTGADESFRGAVPCLV